MKGYVKERTESLECTIGGQRNSDATRKERSLYISDDESDEEDQSVSSFIGDIFEKEAILPPIATPPSRDTSSPPPIQHVGFHVDSPVLQKDTASVCSFPAVPDPVSGDANAKLLTFVSAPFKSTPVSFASSANPNAPDPPASPIPAPVATTSLSASRVIPTKPAPPVPPVPAVDTVDSDQAAQDTKEKMVEEEEEEEEEEEKKKKGEEKEKEEEKKKKKKEEEEEEEEKEEKKEEGENESSITVALSQVTLFPSHTLKVEEDEINILPDPECLMFSVLGMCLDEDQMLHLASASEIQKYNKKPYVPPPVTWSQPVIIVPPEDDDELESTKENITTGGKQRKQVQFQTEGNEKGGSGEDDGTSCSSSKVSSKASSKVNSKVTSKVRSKEGIPSPPRWILLHGRVARALGIQNEDIVVAQFDGQTKRHFLKASVDDRASFNAVVEAEWHDVFDLHPTTSPSAITGGCTVGSGSSSKPSNIFSSSQSRASLRTVELKVETVTDDSGDLNRNARFYLTPVDGLRHGILYFDGAVSAVASKGLVAATGFSIYSCQYGKSKGRGIHGGKNDGGDDDYDDDLDDDLDDDSYTDTSADADRLARKDIESKALWMPSNRTELVSSYRYLGRPFCHNHADYSALIEGLEWLFRFQFDKVTIVGCPDVVSTVRRGRAGRSNHGKGDIFGEIPQLKRANSIARSMIDQAMGRGVKIEYRQAFDDENWEATELAEKALSLLKNETHVFWENVQEAELMDLSKQYRPSSMGYSSEDSEARRPILGTTDLRSCSCDSDEWSTLKGEAVLDEDFKIPDRTSRSQRRRSASDESHYDSCSTEPTCNVIKDEEEDDSEADHESHDAIQGDEEEKEKVKETINTNEDEKEETKEESKELEVEKDTTDQTNVLEPLKVGRGTARWKKLTKALRHRRMSKKKPATKHGYQFLSDNPSPSNQSGEDNQSSWMAEFPEPAPGAKNRRKSFDSWDDRDENGEEEKKSDDCILTHKLMEPSSPNVALNKNAAAGSPTSPIVSSGSMCFLLDLDFLEGAQAVADDIRHLFVGSDKSSADNRQPQEARVVPDPAFSSRPIKLKKRDPDSIENGRASPVEVAKVYLDASPPQPFEKRYAYV